MKNLLSAIVFIILCSSAVFAQSAATIEGNWLGTLEFSGTKLRLGLKVSKAADGTFTAKLDSLDQGAYAHTSLYDLPLADAQFLFDNRNHIGRRLGPERSFRFTVRHGRVAGWWLVPMSGADLLSPARLFLPGRHPALVGRLL